MPRRNSIDQLPKAVREWLDRTLIGGNFAGYQLLEEALREKGYQISKSAIHRYGQKIERRFAAIKASTEAARLLTEGAADDQDARSEAVIALVQTELFETLVNLQEAEDAEDQAERVKLLSTAAKNIATLTRASVGLKRFQAEVRDKIAAKMNALEQEAKSGSGRLDAETLRIVREEIYGIVA